MSPSGPHPAALDPRELAKACAIRFTRRSGPGGQNRNKVETAVILTHTPTGLSAEASEQRTQGENREAALLRLRVNLALSIRCAVASFPSELWKSRCRGGRIVLSPEHVDFPAMLAEALDTLHAHAMDVKTAAAALGCSASQLTKLLKDEPRAMILVNDARARAGLRPLL